MLPVLFAYASAAGQIRSVTIDSIAPPEIPWVSGPDTGDSGTSYDFCAVSDDPNGDDVNISSIGAMTVIQAGQNMLPVEALYVYPILILSPVIT